MAHESTVQKVKDVLHLNKGHTSDTTHTGNTHTGTTTGNTHTGPTTTSHIPGTTSHAEGAHGTHNSRLANAADPRIDSDMDGNRLPNQMSSGYGTADHSTFGTTGPAGTHQHAGTTTSNYPGGATGLPGTHQHTGTTTGTYPGGATGTTGTHHTGMTGGTGFTGGISNSTNAGPHNSNTVNALDPRVDSDLSSTGNRHGAHTGGIMGASGSHATPGSGTAQNTAGPHNNDMVNKVDPRVDANLDGSKTFGGNRTYA